jgi:hypothetical protein
MSQNALERSVGDRQLPQAHKLRALFSVPFGGAQAQFRAASGS